VLDSAYSHALKGLNNIALGSITRLSRGRGVTSAFNRRVAEGGNESASSFGFAQAAINTTLFSRPSSNGITGLQTSLPSGLGRLVELFAFHRARLKPAHVLKGES